jgi:hypothetical protein
MPQVLQWQAQASPQPGAKKRSFIMLWQDGGPSPFETFDPKPEAPAEYRGELQAIDTAIPGVAYSEILPRMAKLAHRTSIIRSLHQPSSDHVVGSHNVLTGWDGETDGGRSRYPDLASIISHMRSGLMDAELLIGASTDPRIARGMRRTGAAPVAGDAPALPRYMDVSGGLHRGGSAFLGPMDGPFQVVGDPSKPGFSVQNLNAVSEPHRLMERREMLARLETRTPNELGIAEAERALDGFRQQAIDLLLGGGAARAFDLSREPLAIRERYGRHLAGHQCLLARRLVEAGVGVVAIRFSPDGRGDYDRTMIGWDDHAVHGNIFEIMRLRGPQFDQALSALIEDLEQRSMSDEVLVVVVGEFGRTPRIHVHKGCPGREHWGAAGCAMLYGGGLRPGQIVGSTNAKGEHPEERPLTYQSLLATIYHALGINPAHTLINAVGRPVPILPSGEPIRELIGTKSPTANGDRQPNRVETFVAADALEPTALGRTRSEATVSVADKSRPLPAALTLRQVESLERDQITELNLRDAAIRDDDLRLLAEFPRLRALELNHVPIGDRGLGHLRNLVTLESLALTGTRTSDAGLEQLSGMTRLKRLEINGTAITLGGVVRLFVEQQGRSLLDALTALRLTRSNERQEIVAIDVAGTSFGDQELRHLDAQIPLTELHLAGTQVTDAGLKYLTRQPQLEMLFLAKCAIGDDGLKELAGMRQLRVLNLYGTRLTSAGLKYLSELHSLRLLLVTDIKLQPAAVDQLKAQLPRLTVTDYTPV